MVALPAAVFDCNIHLQALLNPSGPSGACVMLAMQGRVRLVWSSFIAVELQRVAGSPSLQAKFPSLTVKRIDEYLINIERFALPLERFAQPFVYERDPADALYVNLALASEASHLVTRDRDLLDLALPDNSVAIDFKTRYPALRISDPLVFLTIMRS